VHSISWLPRHDPPVFKMNFSGAVNAFD